MQDLLACNVIMPVIIWRESHLLTTRDCTKMGENKLENLILLRYWVELHTKRMFSGSRMLTKGRLPTISSCNVGTLPTTWKSSLPIVALQFGACVVEILRCGMCGLLQRLLHPK